MKNPVMWLVILQVVAIVAVAFGFVEREAVFFVTAALLLFMALRPLEDGVALFIISIPFFAALPFSESFDSMANWRVLLSVLFVKYLIEELRITDYGLKNRVSKVISDIVHSKLFWIAAAFIFWGFASSLQAAYPAAGIKKMLFLTNIFMAFPIIRYMANRSGLRSMLHSLRYALYSVLAVGFVQLASLFIVPLEQFWRFWAGHVIPVLYGYNLGELLQTSNTWFASGGDGPPTLRMFSVFPDSHSFALFVMLALVVPITSWLQNIQGNEHKTDHAVARPYCSKNFVLILAGFFALIFSGSRGVWLSALGVVLALAGSWLYSRRKLHAELYAFLAKHLLALFALFGILFLPASLISSLAQRAQGGIADSLTGIKRVRSITDLEEVSNRSRLQIWKAALGSIRERPVLGVGPGNFSVALGEDISASRKGASAHNLYLDIASEMGLPGLALFVLLVGFILWRTFSSIPNPSPHTLHAVFFIYFLWILGYSLFDVVLFNDKALISATILAACCYGIIPKPHGISGNKPVTTPAAATAGL